MSDHARFLAYVLRHEPDAVGMQLERGGWVAVPQLLTAFRKHGRRISPDELEKIVSADSKRRFTLSADGQRIRAAQGHTIDVDLELANTEPPAFLYHGTARDTLDVIFREGLRPMRRRLVHLSAEIETAIQVGSRHGKAVVLQIDAAAMFADGRAFYRADNGVWLTEHIPPGYISFV